MSLEEKKPQALARRLAQRAAVQSPSRKDSWRRETYTLPREEAREVARDYFVKFPKAAYMTEIESWRELSGGRIEFTIRRLPSAD
jgi:signal recognition particle subunit SEC65